MCGELTVVEAECAYGRQLGQRLCQPSRPLIAHRCAPQLQVAQARVGRERVSEGGLVAEASAACEEAEEQVQMEVTDGSFRQC